MANLTGNFKTPSGVSQSLDLRVTPLDTRGDILIKLSDIHLITGSYSFSIEEGYYHFDYKQDSPVWVSIGDGFISSSQSSSVQDIVNTTNVILNPTIGFNGTSLITDSSGSVHTLSFENGILKSYVVVEQTSEVTTIQLSGISAPHEAANGEYVDAEYTLTNRTVYTNGTYYIAAIEDEGDYALYDNGDPIVGGGEELLWLGPTAEGPVSDGTISAAGVVITV